MRVQTFELNTGVLSGELPIGLGVMFVAVLFPGSDFRYESVFVGKTAIETWGGDNAKFGLGHVEPAAVFGGVVKLETLGEPPGFGGREGFIQ